MQLPHEIIEAARLDNASEFRVIWNIMTPMSMPALATIALFSFVSHWNDYFWPLVMTDSMAVRPLTMGIAILKQTEPQRPSEHRRFILSTCTGFRKCDLLFSIGSNIMTNEERNG
jgi:ABC-type glycerol-3-phosphate transport system permease component